jgi:hypothetical protein
LVNHLIGSAAWEGWEGGQLGLSSTAFHLMIPVRKRLLVLTMCQVLHGYFSISHSVLTTVIQGGIVVSIFRDEKTEGPGGSMMTQEIESHTCTPSSVWTRPLFPEVLSV